MRGIPFAAGLAAAAAGISCRQRPAPVPQPEDSAPPPAPIARALRDEPRQAIAPDAQPPSDDGAYVRACRLSGLSSGKVKIESNHRISLVDGARTVATGETDDDFHARQVEASCAKRSISLQLDTAHEFREVTLVWKGRQLIATSTVHQRQ